MSAEEPPLKKARLGLSPALQQATADWIAWDGDAVDKKEIEDLVKDGQEEELHKRFDKRIAFGTAGLRATMKAGPAYMNTLIVIQTAQGLCRYLEAQLGKEVVQKRGIVVGFDGRYHSKKFAEATADVFSSQGIAVYLMSEHLVATPLVPYCVNHFKCAAGVMVTASHNPKDDNGYKVYWGNGCQIIPPHDDGIASCILENLAPWNGTPNKDLVSDPTKEVAAAYYTAASALCYHKEENARSKRTVAYTAMHGVGYRWVKESFATFGHPLENLIPTVAQVEPDAEFPTVTFPNPEEGKGALKLAIEAAEAGHTAFILANDPDADRLALAEQQADGSWFVFNGNEIGIILADWSWQQHKAANPGVDASQCAVITTAVSSQMLAAYAKKEGLLYEETLTGFKWLGNKAINIVEEGKTFLFAYEEAIGFMIGDTCYDKDGVRAAAVCMEMYNALTAGLDTLAQQRGVIMNKLMELKASYGFFSIETKYFFCYDPAVMTAIFDRLRNFEEQSGESYPAQCGGVKVIRARDQTTGYDSSTSNHRSDLPTTPGASMLTLWFENGCVATLRGSGTEPKLKYYVEMVGKDEASAVESRQKMQACIVDELLQPGKNSLVSPQSS